MPGKRFDHVRCYPCLKKGIRRRPDVVGLTKEGVKLKCICGHTYTSYSSAAYRLARFFKQSD